jgi:hypothetical protein
MVYHCFVSAKVALVGRTAQVLVRTAAVPTSSVEVRLASPSI